MVARFSSPASSSSQRTSRSIGVSLTFLMVLANQSSSLTLIPIAFANRRNMLMLGTPVFMN
jgi:hypothetical protein